MGLSWMTRAKKACVALGILAFVIAFRSSRCPSQSLPIFVRCVPSSSQQSSLFIRFDCETSVSHCSLVETFAERSDDTFQSVLRLSRTGAAVERTPVILRAN